MSYGMSLIVWGETSAKIKGVPWMSNQFPAECKIWNLTISILGDINHDDSYIPQDGLQDELLEFVNCERAPTQPLLI